jgi:hypothetical protein
MQNLDVLVGDSSEGDISSRIAAVLKKASADRARYEHEIRRMEKLLGELEAEKRDRGLEGGAGLTTSLQRTVSSLTAQINSVRLFVYFYSPPQFTCLHSYITEMLTLRKNFRNRY